MIHYRILTPDDLEAWHPLRLSALRNSPTAFLATPEDYEKLTEEELASRIVHDHNRFVNGAFDGENTMVGMAAIIRQDHPKVRHKATIWGTYVVPEYRGMGIGKKLMQSILENQSLLPGLQQVQLCVVATQEPAMALYKSLGFQTYGAEKAAVLVNGQLLDEYHMQLLLDPAS